jgi:hypothetical protein
MLGSLMEQPATIPRRKPQLGLLIGRTTGPTS